MDELKQDTTESVWIPVSRIYEIHEDIILRIPNFSTFERFLIVGGGNAADIYDRMMEITYPKRLKLVLKIMNELKNKALQNIKPIRTITGIF